MTVGNYKGGIPAREMLVAGTMSDFSKIENQVFASNFEKRKFGVGPIPIVSKQETMEDHLLKALSDFHSVEDADCEKETTRTKSFDSEFKQCKKLYEDGIDDLFIEVENGLNPVEENIQKFPYRKLSVGLKSYVKDYRLALLQRINNNSRLTNANKLHYFWTILKGNNESVLLTENADLVKQELEDVRMHDAAVKIQPTVVIFKELIGAAETQAERDEIAKLQGFEFAKQVLDYADRVSSEKLDIEEDNPFTIQPVSDPEAVEQISQATFQNVVETEEEEAPILSYLLPYAQLTPEESRPAFIESIVTSEMSMDDKATVLFSLIVGRIPDQFDTDPQVQLLDSVKGCLVALASGVPISDDKGSIGGPGMSPLSMFYPPKFALYKRVIEGMVKANGFRALKLLLELNKKYGFNPQFLGRISGDFNMAGRSNIMTYDPVEDYINLVRDQGVTEREDFDKKIAKEIVTIVTRLWNVMNPKISKEDDLK